MYLNPLRRKIGVLTLLTASVFAAGWVRSLYAIDSVFDTTAKSYFEFISINGFLLSARATYQGEATARPFQHFQSSGVFFGSMIHTSETWRLTVDLGVEWQNAIWGDFQYSTAEKVTPEGRLHVVAWMIPYWSIVLPPTLISAGLLLGKSRLKRAT